MHAGLHVWARRHHCISATSINCSENSSCKMAYEILRIIDTGQEMHILDRSPVGMPPGIKKSFRPVRKIPAAEYICSVNPGTDECIERCWKGRPSPGSSHIVVVMRYINAGVMVAWIGKHGISECVSHTPGLIDSGMEVRLTTMDILDDGTMKSQQKRDARIVPAMAENVVNVYHPKAGIIPEAVDDNRCRPIHCIPAFFRQKGEGSCCHAAVNRRH
ncbi:MAG: hypothetical protein A3K90_00680 [Pelodictyon luteolum]|uniref:Uncharacterized protein n=1 Tax=Pelodictyon luteolum TaxID=1100 RepID=A0A165MFV1_PELLU|nr:MAG: hypothetical protein A3K90_00680 [Pelodictyon luteolum]